MLVINGLIAGKNLAKAGWQISIVLIAKMVDQGSLNKLVKNVSILAKFHTVINVHTFHD